ncbi:uncharacterized protein AB9W97_005770 [Spinachia spinachia]
MKVKRNRRDERGEGFVGQRGGMKGRIMCGGKEREEGQAGVVDPIQLTTAAKKKSIKKTGVGPAPPHYTPAEELALGLNANRPIVEGIPGGSSSLNLQPETSSSNTLITVLHNTPTLLPVAKEVVAEICADSEETFLDDCPLEEVLVIEVTPT